MTLQLINTGSPRSMSLLNVVMWSIKSETSRTHKKTNRGLKGKRNLLKKNDNNFFNFTMRIAYFSLNPSIFAVTDITQCLYQDDQIYYVTKFNRHVELGLPVEPSDKSVVMWAPLSPAGLKTWERQKFHHWWMKLPAKIQNRNPLMKLITTKMYSYYSILLLY